ncbi:DDE Tnp 4 domain containing protein, partial [Asbolus verrucosus]
PGSAHDSRIWRSITICQLLRESNANVVLLRDQGYGIEKYLMTPYRQPRTPPEFSYNRLFKTERVIIERCFR